MTDQSPDFTDFEPAPSPARHDGWTAERQLDFIEALAETGCVADACRRVGISTTSAYALRRRVDAMAFRQAWEAALEYAIRRLSDAVYSRAIHGVPVPHYYQGEQVGEHRRYDERLAMFLLRYRDPASYGRALDEFVHDYVPEIFSRQLADRLDTLAEEVYGDDGPVDLPPRRNDVAG